MLTLSLPTVTAFDAATSASGHASHAEALAARGNLRSFRRGAILIQEGDTGDTLYMVRSGRLRAYAAHPIRLIRRARLATESASSLALIDVYGRMTRLLDQFASPPAADGTRTVEERITHREIASHLACSREMVTRLMRDLETGGYVAVRERRIVLLKGLPARW